MIVYVFITENRNVLCNNSINGNANYFLNNKINELFQFELQTVESSRRCRHRRVSFIYTPSDGAFASAHTVALVCAPRFQLKAFVALLASAI